MIFTERKITVRKGKSSIDEPVILYRGDYEVELRFIIMETKFRFKSGVNLVDSEKASHAQLALLAPDGANVFTEIGRCEDGTAIFTLSKEMIDELSEVGLYSFQIRLFDYYRESRVSIPPVEFGIEVREPIAAEDHTNAVDDAMVGYSIAKISVLDEPVPETFDDNGQYNKTDWETGDRITEGKLNKIEDAIDTINQNEKNDVAALDKRITNNFNVLDSSKADKNEIFSMVNMGQDVKEAMTGGSVAVVGENTILTENIVDNQVTWGKRTPIGSTFYLSPGSGGFPNYDTTTRTLTIYTDTLIYYGTSYWITEEEIIIDFSTTENFTLWFDPENKTFEPLYFKYDPSNIENKIRVCTCKALTHPFLTSCPFTFKINGEFPWVKKDEIPDIMDSYPSNGCFFISGKAGDEFGMIKIDSTNMTLTVPKSGSLDAGFIINGKYYLISTYNTEVVFSLEKSFTTSLGKILFEFSSKNITVIPYYNSYDKSQYYMLGTIRYSNPLTVNLCVPYMLDGKPYGITTFTITNDDIITEVEKGKNAAAEINIACGSGHTLTEQLPIFDSENLTLTFPKGGYGPTGWFINGGYKECIAYNTDVVLDLTKTISSSLGKILVKPSTFSITAFEYQIINWSQSYDYSTWVMIGSIRYGNPPGLSLFCPFIQNDKLYGIDYVTSEDVGGLLYRNDKDAYVKSISHRGYNSAPENTLSAYILSKKKGYSYVECDVRFTSDGVPVLLHDETIDRTSNGTGNIAEMTFDEVRALDFGSWKSSDYAGEQIPTLDEFLLLCKRLDMHPYIELKAQYNESYQIIYDTIKKRGFDKKCTVLGGGAATANALPHARLGLVTSSISSSLVETAKTCLTETNEVFIDYQNALVTEEDRVVCEEAIAAGIQLEVWNVFTKEDILTNVDLGATGITNDSLNVAKLMREDFE